MNQRAFQIFVERGMEAQKACDEFMEKVKGTPASRPLPTIEELEDRLTRIVQPVILPDRCPVCHVELVVKNVSTRYAEDGTAFAVLWRHCDNPACGKYSQREEVQA